MMLTLMAIVFSTQAQSVKELEAQRKQTLQRLESTNKMLNETKNSKRSSLNKLTIIKKNITERKVLIKNISTEIGQLDTEIVHLDQEKTKLETKLQQLKSDYAKLVQEAHINQNLYARIMFVLSAKTFDQSYRRLRYLQEYSDYRKNQVNEIEKVKTEIVHKNDSLQVHKTTKVKVVQQKENEAQKLSKDESHEKVLLTDLQKKEKNLRADLKIQQKKANDLNNKIERIIAEEIRKADARRAAAEKKRVAENNRRQTEQNRRLEEQSKARTVTKNIAKGAPKNAPKSYTKSLSKSESRPEPESKATENDNSTSSSVSALTREENLLSGNFERNVGRLPWPTSNGFIRGHFGIQQHPVLTHVTTNNKGIYIQTPSGSNARAVFEGVVTQRFSIPGSNNGVIIQHGNYRTVYANLTQIFVKEGEKVSAKQAIGKIYTDDENGNKTELYFQVWKDKNVQNPERWISR
ncbi:MAG: peptidoglycan DD-metalloendopeptidase family protein [Paludibacter sp.]|nr:peptidoglycan DD-metalloendopeptidase family protein [Paludibacter sp.]